MPPLVKIDQCRVVGRHNSTSQTNLVNVLVVHEVGKIEVEQAALGNDEGT